MEKIELLEPIQKILAPHKNKGLHITSIVRLLQEQNLFLSGMTDKEIRAMAKELLDEHSKTGGEFDRVHKSNGGVKSGYYKIRAKRGQGPIPPLPLVDPDYENTEDPTSNTQFFGKAGEYAVMAQLLFRDFNANNMTVDEGIDIIASKDNNFYFVQVKTTRLKDKKAIVSIKQKNFDRFMNQQMRYVIVVTHSKGMRFFTLSNSAIEQLKYYRALAVNETTGNISIKIRFDDNLSRPVFYDRTEVDASFYEGFARFEL